jgi:hypothetical protein
MSPGGTDKTSGVTDGMDIRLSSDIRRDTSLLLVVEEATLLLLLGGLPSKLLGVYDMD